MLILYDACLDMISLNRLEMWDMLLMANTAKSLKHEDQERSWLKHAAALLNTGQAVPPGMAHMEPLLQQVLLVRYFITSVSY